jgi:hypothetical protein
MRTHAWLDKAVIVAAACLFVGETELQADVTTAAIRETAEFVMKKFGKETAAEGVEALSQQIGKLAGRYGDDALEAVKKVGPKALRVADEAGPESATALRAMAKYGDDGLRFVAESPQTLSLVAKYGDDAAEALIKHKGVAEPVIVQFGSSGARALKAVDGQGAKRLAMMTADGDLERLGQATELLDVVARYGDRAANFIWNNKGALAVGTALAAFLANPEPFLDGTLDLTKIVAENTVKPLIDNASASLDWTVFAIVVVMAVALVQVWRSYLRHRAELRRVAAK